MLMEQLAETLGGLIIVTGIVLIVYFIGRYTFLIKKMLAEKGLLSQNTEARFTKIEIAYTIIGVGFGLLAAAGLSLLELSEDTLDYLTWGIVLISGAIGLLLASKQKQ